MEESPVINDSDDFVPMDLVDAVPDEALGDAPPDAPDELYEPDPPAAPDEPDGSPVHEPSDDFVPMAAPAAPAAAGRMPTPNQVLHLSSEDKRLDTVPFESADIRALAQRILKRAQEQGQAKLDSARKQVEAMEKAAYDKAYKEAFSKGQQEGFAKGEKDGKAEAQTQINEAIEAEKETLRNHVAPVADTLQQVAEAFTAAKDQLMAQAEGDLLMLALDLAKRLVNHELSVNPDAIKPLALECIGLVTDRTTLTVRVNPEDKEVMDEYYPDLKLIFPDLGPVVIQADPAVERGGIMAATREAEVDMRLATRLAAFEEVILGVSGDDAVPPWGAIPEDAIAAAKAASAESAYSLWDDSTQPQAEEAQAENAEEAPGLSSLENVAEPAAEETEPSPVNEPAAAEPAEPAAEGDLSDLVDLVDDQIDDEGQPPES
ncbi:MAG: hypothetical protein LUC93_10050 [Planctomycetaceae bacterium]|nr:hypothetical protein [Planctomycetaceae bacterium]